MLNLSKQQKQEIENAIKLTKIKPSTMIKIIKPNIENIINKNIYSYQEITEMVNKELKNIDKNLKINYKNFYRIWKNITKENKPKEETIQPEKKEKEKKIDELLKNGSAFSTDLDQLDFN